jgi:hypothetical protein
MSQRIYHAQLHAIMYVLKTTKDTIQAAAMNASAQSRMITPVQALLEVAILPDP